MCLERWRLPLKQLVVAAKKNENSINYHFQLDIDIQYSASAFKLLKCLYLSLDPSITCAYAPYAPNWLNTKGFSKFMWPAICCIRRNCRSFSVSANLTTKLEDAPCKWIKREEERNGNNERKLHEWNEWS